MPENPDVTTSAAPSAANETPEAKSYAAGKLTAEISKQFSDRAQGKEPAAKQADTAAADTSKETISEDEKSKSAAAPDSAKETQERGSRRKPSAEERIAELTAKVRELEGKTKQAPAAKEAESATAKPAEVKAQTLEAPKEPDIADPKYNTGNGDADFKLYEADVRKFTRDLAKYEAAKAVEDYKKSQTEAAQGKQLESELTAARERYKDFDTVVAPLWQEIATDKQIHPAVQEFVGRSPVMVDLMYAIGGNADTMKEFLAAARSDPFKAMRVAMKAEELVMAELAKGKTESKSEPESKEKKEPPAKKATEEPTPNREVGNRGTGPTDAAADAVRRNDFSSFSKEQMRRAAERHRQ